MFVYSANVCHCPRGVPASGAKCVAHGDWICAECSAGFQLNRTSSICVGAFADGVESDFELNFTFVCNLEPTFVFQFNMDAQDDS